MIIKTPKPIIYIENYKRLNKRFVRFESLIVELNTLDLQDDILIAINEFIDKLNSIHETKKSFSKQLKTAQNDILKLLENKLNIVPSNHYTTKYMAIGIALGLGLGSAIGAASSNMAQTGIWLPIGLAIGLTYGNKLDKKAKEEGKALNFEIK